MAKYVSSKDKVQLFKDNDKAMFDLANQIRGSTPMLKLSKLPDDIKTGGHIGWLVTSNETAV